jgi:hypothetical protein
VHVHVHVPHPCPCSCSCCSCCACVHVHMCMHVRCANMAESDETTAPADVAVVETLAEAMRRASATEPCRGPRRLPTHTRSARHTHTHRGARQGPSEHAPPEGGAMQRGRCTAEREMQCRGRCNAEGDAMQREVQCREGGAMQREMQCRGRCNAERESPAVLHLSSSSSSSSSSPAESASYVVGSSAVGSAAAPSPGWTTACCQNVHGAPKNENEPHRRNRWTGGADRDSEHEMIRDDTR